MMVVSSVVGAACIAVGSFASYDLSVRVGVDIPTGPFIILLAAGLYGVSALVHASREHRSSER